MGVFIDFIFPKDTVCFVIVKAAIELSQISSYHFSLIRLVIIFSASANMILASVLSLVLFDFNYVYLRKLYCSCASRKVKE